MKHTHRSRWMDLLTGFYGSDCVRVPARARQLQFKHEKEAFGLLVVLVERIEKCMLKSIKIMKRYWNYTIHNSNNDFTVRYCAVVWLCCSFRGHTLQFKWWTQPLHLLWPKHKSLQFSHSNHMTHNSGIKFYAHNHSISISIRVYFYQIFLFVQIIQKTWLNLMLWLMTY